MAKTIKRKILKNKRVVVTAGASMEDIDPVRYITNRSSGKMGIRFAEVAKQMGAEVILIHGHVDQPLPKGVKTVCVRGALETLDELKNYLENAQVLIMAGAISDYRVKDVSGQKIKKGDENLKIELVKNPDILKTLKPDKGDRIHVSFALETENLLENAKKKLKEKGADLLVANKADSFGKDETEVYLLHQNGSTDHIKATDKSNIARLVLTEVYKLLNGNNI